MKKHRFLSGHERLTSALHLEGRRGFDKAVEAEDRMLGVGCQTTAGKPKHTTCEIAGRFAAARK